jgi:hypothetical protein
MLLFVFLVLAELLNYCLNFLFKIYDNNMMSPQNIVHYKIQHHMTLEIKALDRHNEVAEINQLMGYQPHLAI